MLCRLNVSGDLAGVSRVVVRQHVGVGHAQRFQAQNAGHLLQIGKMRVGVLCIPGKIVEGRVIHAVRAFRPDVRGGHARVLQERCKVGTRTQVTDADLFIACGRRIRSLVFVVLAALHSPLLINRSAHGAGNGAGQIAEKLFQRRHGGGREIRTRDCYVHVEVRHGMVERLALLLHPLR